MAQLLDDILVGTNIHCSDRVRVFETIHRIIKDGACNLQLLTDFDHTLTQYHVVSKATPGLVKTGLSSFGVVQDILPDGYRKEVELLVKTYYPIETDPNRSVADKLPHMIEWWTREIDTMATYGLRKQDIASGIAKSDVQLRDYCKDVLVTLNRLNIPVLLLSAGVSETIEEILRQQAIFTPENMHLVANRLKFDEQGLCLGRLTESDLIHTFNKAEISARFAARLARRNVIILGDMLADLDAITVRQDGFSNVLKIGYLNMRETEQLDTYKAHFDIVLTGDPGLELLWNIVKQL